MFDLTRQSEQRQKIQEQAIEVFMRNTHTLLSFSTGVGKSLTALKCVEKFGASSVLLLVKETNHEQNWRDEFIKHRYEDMLERTDIYCYASLHKLQGNDYDVIILDECHALSEYREDLLHGLRSVKIISLSATVPQDVKIRLNNLSPFEEYHISLDEAIERGVLPEPVIEIKLLELKTDERVYPFKAGKKTVMLTQRDYYKRLDNSVSYWQEKVNTEGLEWQKKRLFMAALKRKKFLGEEKTSIARRELEDMTRFICFCSSVKQAKELGSATAIHSKNTKEKNQELISSFNNHSTDSLFCVNMAREGLNLTDIKECLIIQLDAEILPTTQKLGRSMRSEKPLIKILCYQGTQDKRYLNTFLDTINPKYITYT